MRVLCATCNMKPVDRSSWWVDDMGKTAHFKAECHGASVATEIDLRILTPKQLRAIEQQDGVAFMPAPKLK